MQGLCNGREWQASVCRTVCSSIYPVDRQQRRRAAGLLLSAQRQQRRSTVLSSKCGQCHIGSHGTRLNRLDLVRPPGLSVEESFRMTEDRDKWRKYVHNVANPRIEDG